MKVSHIGIIAVMLLVIAVACAGCSSAQTSTPSGGTGQAGAASSGGGAASSGSGAASSGSGSSGSSGGAGSSVSAASLFGGLNYNWIEYKMSTSGSGSQAMTIYIKYEKGGKCTMRFDPAPQGMPATMDCSSTGGKTVSNPNDVSSTPSDVKFMDVGPDVVTVPAGTYTAEKYTATMKGSTVTYWVVKGTGLVKMQGGSSGQGSMTMELNAIG
jgi:hypothetical protein